jgi:hypothetical protein
LTLSRTEDRECGSSKNISVRVTSHNREDASCAPKTAASVNVAPLARQKIASLRNRS